MRFSERKRLYLNLGIEQAEVDLGTDPEDFNEGESASASEIESVGEVKELTADVDQLDDFAAATDATMDLNVAVESALASGKGLNRIEAAALTKALKASVGRYITIENNLVPAIESYDVTVHDGRAASADTNNKEQTTAAKKGIKEGIKAFIEAIIKKIKTIIIAAKGFFKKIHDRTSIGIRRLANAFRTLKQSEYFGEIKTKYNTTNIYMEGGYTPDKFAESMMVLLLTATKIANGETANSEQETKFLSDGIEALKQSDISSWDKVRVALRAYMATSFSSMFEGKVSKQGDGTVVSETFPGGKRMVFSPGNDTGTNQLPTISLRRTDKPEGDPTTEINLPDRDTFKGLLQASMSMMNTMWQATKERNQSSFDKAYKEVIDKLDATKSLKDAKIEGNKEILTSISMFTGSSAAFRSKVFWFAIDQISGICQMVELAIKLNEESKKQKEKETTA